MKTMSVERARMDGRFRAKCCSSFALLGACAALALSLSARPAAACGGFFCSASNPVNQAAERIVFAHNDDGTVTAVIEIQYQGPSKNFSWLLPIVGVPKDEQLAIASNAAFQRLQQATNPQYNLTVRVEGTCDQETTQGNRGFQSPTAGGPVSAEDSRNHGVTVEASGSVGPFDWTVISLAASLKDPAAAAVQWLGDNGYDVPTGAPGLLGPYLQDGLNLLALRLQKGQDAGSIRPIVLTYDAEKPMIPIKLTAVAANDDMGVMTWILGDARAVPLNYASLELNEARINWFSASVNYNDVVTAAANDAGGQGFVTEMAGDTAMLKDTVWSRFDEQSWVDLTNLPATSTQIYQVAASAFGSYDGFFDVVEKHATLPSGVSIEQLKRSGGYYPNITVDTGFTAALEANVIEPMRVVQKLIDAHPTVTRLYTTMSAAEMTVDPLFTFNADLPAVSNIHTAERVIECAPGYYQSEAPWRIELPHGGVVRGGPSDIGAWPAAFDAQAPNQRVVRQGSSGSGKVVEDHSADIIDAVNAYSATVAKPPRRDDVGGCSSSGKSPQGSSWLAGVGLVAVLWRRRR